MTPENINPNVEVNEKSSSEKHFLEEGFNKLWQYEVQKEDWSETLYSIMNESISRNIPVDDRTILRSTFLNNIEQVEAIQKWDIIELNQIDNNSYEISIWENIYIINIFNESFIKIWWENKQENTNKIETNESLENSLIVETNKAQIGHFAWVRDTYTIKAWNNIEWHLPTTAEPIDLLIDVDPNKIISITKQIISGETSKQNVKIQELIIDWTNPNIPENMSARFMQDFEWFVEAVKNWTKFQVYKEMTQ